MKIADLILFALIYSGIDSLGLRPPPAVIILIFLDSNPACFSLRKFSTF